MACHLRDRKAERLSYLNWAESIPVVFQWNWISTFGEDLPEAIKIALARRRAKVKPLGPD